MTDNYINVTVTSKENKRVTVSTQEPGFEVTATTDTGKFWANTAERWATSDTIVENKDYSSKYYANKAKVSEENASAYEKAAKETYNTFFIESGNITNEVRNAGQESVNSIEASRLDAVDSINIVKNTAVDSINATKTTILKDIEFVADGEKKEIEDLIDNGKEELKESIGDVKVLTTLEIGDIGFTQMAIDETKGKRRILNGQLIIQEQYTQFTQIVKNSVALNADLACTEDEWQTAVTMSANGVCYKYVIDDEAGTIRLPKYPTYLDLSINGAKTVSVYGNGKTLGLSDGNKIASIIWGTGSYTGHQMGSYDGANKKIGSVVGGSWTTGSNYTAIGVTTDATKSGLTGSVTTSSEQIKGTYFIQVATGAETEDNIVNILELNNPFILLEPKFFESKVYNVSWLLANGTYNGSNVVHPSAYQALLVENNAEVTIGSTVTLPIGTEYTKRGLSVKLSTDSNITDYDFVVNTSDETFRLPIKVNLASGKAVVGNGMTLGLTDGTNNYGLWTGASACGTNTNIYGKDIGTANNTQSGSNKSIGIIPDPTKSGIELSDSDLYLYFYVGETVQNANLINAGRVFEVVQNINSQVENDLYYRPGDVFELKTVLYTAGTITSSAQAVCFSIPVEKSLENITTITPEALVVGFRKDNGGYMPSDTWDAVANADNIIIYKPTNNVIYIRVMYSNFGGVNNTPVGVGVINLRIRFS